jgi:hypothetical protein
LSAWNFRRVSLRHRLFAALVFLAAACSPEAPPSGNSQTAAAAPAAAERMVAPILNAPDAKDIHSFARPHEARVTHVALDLRADFTAKRMAGTATLDIAAAPGAKTVVLDTRGLEIESVAAAESRRSADRRARRGRQDPHRLSLGAGRRGAAVAEPRPDGRQEASLPVQPGPGDPQPQLDTDPGQPRHPADLGGADRRARAAEGGDER